jgi:integrase
MSAIPRSPLPFPPPAVDLEAIGRKIDALAAAVTPRRLGDEPVAPLVEEYGQVLVARARTMIHAQATANRVRRVLEEAGIARACEIAESPVQRAIGSMTWCRGLPRGRPLSLKSRYHYWRAAKSFSLWLTRKGVLGADPLRDMPGYNASVDPRHARHVWTPDELRRLVRAAWSGPVVRGVGGEERAMLYVFLADTALRPGTARRLTRASLVALDGELPHVAIEPAAVKDRKARAHPLRHDTAAMLRTYLAKHGGAPADPLFRLPDDPTRMVFMLRSDLARARLPYVDDAGRYRDVYSLRHSALTRMALEGMPMAVLQQVAGHSTIAVTAKYYVHVVARHVADAINALPAVFDNEIGGRP